MLMINNNLKIHTIKSKTQRIIGKYDMEKIM